MVNTTDRRTSVGFRKCFAQLLSFFCFCSSDGVSEATWSFNKTGSTGPAFHPSFCLLLFSLGAGGPPPLLFIAYRRAYIWVHLRHSLLPSTSSGLPLLFRAGAETRHVRRHFGEKRRRHIAGICHPDLFPVNRKELGILSFSCL